MTTHRTQRAAIRGLDHQPLAAEPSTRPTRTFPPSTRSLDMLLMHEELARAQIAERHAKMAQSIHISRLAAARRRQRRAESARRRMRLSLAAAR